MSTTEPRLLTTAEVCTRLGITRQAVDCLRMSKALMPVDAVEHRVHGAPRARWTYHYAPADVLAYQRWRETGQTGAPPACPGDLTLRQAAACIGKKYVTVHHAVYRGSLPVHRHGTRRYVRREDVDARWPQTQKVAP